MIFGRAQYTNASEKKARQQESEESEEEDVLDDSGDELDQELSTRYDGIISLYVNKRPRMRTQ
jgi:hypothetical protein